VRAALRGGGCTACGLLGGMPPSAPCRARARQCCRLGEGKEFPPLGDYGRRLGLGIVSGGQVALCAGWTLPEGAASVLAGGAFRGPRSTTTGIALALGSGLAP